MQNNYSVNRANSIKILLLILILLPNFAVIFHFAFAETQLPIVITYKINNPFMTVNGKTLEIDSVTKATPLIVREWRRSIVPARSLIETLGGTIEWDPIEKKVSAKFKSAFIELWIDNPKYRVNGDELWIDEANHEVKPIILNNRTYIPLRFISEAMGSKVEWISNLQTIKITFPDSIVKLPDNEIVAKVKAQDTLTFKIPIKNPFLWKTTIRIRLLSNNCPKDWSSDFCVKNACYFKEGEIDLVPKELVELVVSIYTVSLSDANYSLVITGDETPEEIVKILIKEER